MANQAIHKNTGASSSRDASRTRISFGSQVGTNFLAELFRLTPSLEALIIGIVVFIIYANSIPNGYALDDANVVQQNAYTQKGFAGIPDILSKDSFHGRHGDRSYYSRYYRPLSLVTFAIEHGLWGDIPYVSHFINVLLYGITCIILWLTLKNYFFPHSSDLPLLITLLFAVHPIHTEVVANIKGRDEILSLLFALAALYLSFSHMQKRGWSALLAVCICFFLALISKENAVTYVGIIPLALFFFSTLSLRKIIQFTFILLGVLAFYMLLRHRIVGGTSFDVPALDLMMNRFFDSPPGEKYATSFYIIAFYIRLLFYPHPLSWDYAYKEIPFFNFSDPAIWAVLGMHLLLVGGSLWLLPKKNPAAFGVLYFYMSIFLVSNLVLNIGGFVGERFLYQASVGFVIAIGVLLSKLPIPNLAIQRAVILGITGLLIILGSGKTIARNFDWADNITLFLTDVNAAPGSARTNHAAGVINLFLSQKEKDPQKKKEYMDKAIAYLRKALAIYPKYADANLEIGRAFLILGEPDSVEKYWVKFQKDLMFSDEHPQVQQNKQYLSDLYHRKAKEMHAAGKLEQALQLLDKALFHYPANHTAWYDKGVYLMPTNDLEQMTICFEKAVELNPRSIPYLYNLAVCHFFARRYDKAKFYFNQILAIDPNHLDTKKALSQIPN
jgi:tetratricopeptide (TPR) repeat protein